MNENTKGKIKELLRYIVIGFATTFINWFVQILFTEWVKLPGSVGAIIAWIVSTIFFAFWAYKFFVFRSKSMNRGLLVTEFVGFTSARLLTLGIEALIMLVFVDLLKFDNTIRIGFVREIISETNGKEFVSATQAIGSIPIRERYIVKLVACVIITILNYVFSKLIVFKKGQYKDSVEEPAAPAQEQTEEASGTQAELLEPIEIPDDEAK